MWFFVSFFKDRIPISAAIAENGQVFFKASDVARFLGYSDTTGFARRYAKHDLNQMVPDKFKVPHHKVHVLSFDEMIKVISITQRNHRLTCSDINLTEMNLLWKQGLVPFKFPYFPPRNRISAPVLYFEKDDGDMCIQKWIQIYSLMVAKMFSAYRKPEKKTPISILQNNDESNSNNLIIDMDTQPSSVPSNIQASDKEFEYDQIPSVKSEPNFQSPSSVFSNFESHNECEDVDGKKDELVNLQTPLGLFETPPSSVSPESTKDESENLVKDKNEQKMLLKISNDESPMTFKSENFVLSIFYDGLIKFPEKINIINRENKHTYMQNGI